MRIFFIGDVFGKGGNKAVRYLLPKIVDHEYVDLTIANVENVSGGIGVSREAVNELKEAGVHVMTSGNHVWKKPGVEDLFKVEPFLIVGSLHFSLLLKHSDIFAALRVSGDSFYSTRSTPASSGISSLSFLSIPILSVC